MTIILAFLCAAFACAAVVSFVWQKNKQREILDSLSDMMDKYADGRASKIVYVARMTQEELRLGRILNAKFLEEQQKKENRPNLPPVVNEIIRQVREPVDEIEKTLESLHEQTRLGGHVFTLCESVQVSAGQLVNAMDVVLAANRMDKGVEAQLQRTDVMELLNLVKADMAEAASAKGIRLDVVEVEGIFAEMDLPLARRALNCILDNAIKYTPKDGQVSVSTMRFEDNCRIDISDSGPGISVERHPKVFDRYFRYPDEETSEGLGLGLYVAKKAITSQGGNIRLSSFPGQGSTFSVLLPLAEEEPEQGGEWAEMY